MSEARVKATFGDAVIEAEGSEAFLNAQCRAFFDLVRERIAPKDAAPKEAVAPAPSPADEVDITGIFTVSNRGVVRIDHDIPGNNRREQMVNAARLLAYAVERLQNRRLVPIVQVIATCKAHRCYDKNLVTALRKQGTSLVLSGGRRRLTIALTEAGRNEAVRLIRTFRPSTSLPDTPRSPA